MNITEIINNYVSENIDKINDGLDRAIENQGLDPAGGQSHGKFDAGSIDLGICTATAFASYTAQGLNGLSKSKFLNLKFSNISTSDDGEFSGAGVFEVGTQESLTANAYGSVHAGCGFVSKTVTLGAKATISGYKLSGYISISGNLTGNKIEIKSLHFEMSNTDVGSVSVNVEGLGIFNFLVDAIASGLASGFTSLVTKSGPSIVNAINGEIIDSLLPIEIDIN